MVRYRGPRVKIVRRLGHIGPLPGLTQKLIPRQRQRRPQKPSKFAVRLMQKQRLRYHYGLSERQLVNYIKKARRMGGSTSDQLFLQLEARLDNMIFRLNLAPTIASARQLVTHGHIEVNNQRINCPSYSCKPDDKISVKDSPKSQKLVKEQLKSDYTKTEVTSQRPLRQPRLPPNVTFNKTDLTAVVRSNIRRDWIGLPMKSKVQDRYIVEYYARRGGR